MKVCCFTGHRPDRFPFGRDEGGAQCKRLKAALKKEIESAVADGYRHFIAGGALGVDMWAAEIVCQLKRTLPLCLEIAVPFEGYNGKLAGVNAERFYKIKQMADRLTAVRDFEGTAAILDRNRYMVDNSRRLIAVWDERSGIWGGTYSTLKYAREKGLEIRQIRWMGM